MHLLIWISNFLNTNKLQNSWLFFHPNTSSNIFHYLLKNSSSENKKEVLHHIQRLTSDTSYQHFLVFYEKYYGCQNMWWENLQFLSPYGNGESTYGEWAIRYLMTHDSIPFSIFKNQFMGIPEGNEEMY